MATTRSTGGFGRKTALRVLCACWFCIASPSIVLADAGEKLLGQPAPDFALKTLTGENLRLSEFRGEVVLVNFWATWCGPCREQMPVLNDLHVQFRDQGLRILGVSIDRKNKRSTKQLAKKQQQFPVLLDSRKDVSRLYDLNDMPFAVLIDQTGTVRAVFDGFDNDDEQLYQTQVAALMAE